jgi:hypothetical protein
MKKQKTPPDLHASNPQDPAHRLIARKPTSKRHEPEAQTSDDLTRSPRPTRQSFIAAEELGKRDGSPADPKSATITLSSDAFISAVISPRIAIARNRGRSAGANA